MNPFTCPVCGEACRIIRVEFIDREESYLAPSIEYGLQCMTHGMISGKINTPIHSDDPRTQELISRFEYWIRNSFEQDRLLRERYGI